MRSLRGRLTLGITLVLAVVLAGAGVMVSRYVDRSERAALDDCLKRTAELSRDTSVAALQEGVPPSDPRLDNVLSASGTTLRLIVGPTVIRESGRPAPSEAIPPSDGLRTFTAARPPLPRVRDERPGRGPRRARALRGHEPAGAGRAQAGAARTAASRRSASPRCSSAAAGRGSPRRCCSPRCARLRAATSRIAGTEDLDQRVPGDDGPAELRSLAASFNDMLARLGRSAADRERALAATRRFTADAGHELRTPLTSVQATLSALSRHPDIPVAQRTELVLDALAEHRRLVDLLDGLQAMARGDASPGELADVELGDVVAASLDQASSRHPGGRRGRRRCPTSRSGCAAGSRACGCSSTTCSRTRRATAGRTGTST